MYIAISHITSIQKNDLQARFHNLQTAQLVGLSLFKLGNKKDHKHKAISMASMIYQ